ncbi:RNA 2',3'-cyclic phosphodiesterase [Dictyobacter arantiisoli]|uniref:RNA 2',3'-cyclic phosphodiesterase n=1 Tax=Dictyobacter arantiisoli TaxID=2014874 RepID=A0A5A5TC79_9CHLR|nr:RNA 2',3'-cyclic phosphodiesterase [Dictyobacter arantiisoli]GCF08619.1 RNA 2',3'-cyclic phosphodiesterase [Dictyobacter arantiisoli]
MTRTFIALNMNKAMQSHLSGVIQQVATVLPELRCVDASNIHLTLAFLGELDDEQLAAAAAATQEAAQQATSFTYRLTGLGIFGSPRQPRVLWMGLQEPTGSLTRLHASLSHSLIQRGFSVDSRPFSPHLTLARGKAPLNPEAQSALQKLLSGTAPSRQSYPATYLHVMKSQFTPAGVKYSSLHSYPLKPQ